MDEKHPLIRHLERIAGDDERRDPGALASLRRGLGQPPGACAPMFPHVIPYLTEKEQQYQFAEFCLLAALFAYHPKSTRSGNLGSHLRAAAGDNIDSTERRFTALLRAHRDDLHHHLRQAVGFLKSRDDEPVNWSQLCRDILDWDHPSGRVQKAWARGFWGFYQPEDEQKQKNNEEN